MKKSDEPVVVVLRFSCPADLVWKAISELARMRSWYFPGIPDFQPRVGFRTGFDVDAGTRIFPHRWEVSEVVPGSRLAYHWTFEGYPGKSTSVFDIAEEGNGSQLTLTCLVDEDFPDGIPEFTRESCLGGWNYLLGESLKRYLEGASLKGIEVGK
jgi:uncharacterized protein YndB with AHSA1/START domain